MARTSRYVQETEALFSASKMWKAGLYLRLSKEDGDKIESDSICNQKFIIEDFLVENPDINIEDIYSDDGYTGTNFNRPDFIRLIEDIRIGRINCVIVKDLSRFGRNYVEAGQYLDTFFPVMEIRFISVIDIIDSYLYPSSMNNISVPFKNVMNEEYCRDISIKVRSSKNIKRENGEHIGSFVLYGYNKDLKNKGKIIVDDEAAGVVKTIYKLFLQGNSMNGIATKLNELSVLCPYEYKKSKGMKYKGRSCNKNSMWVCSTIRRILKERMYVGDMVQGRNEIISYKVNKARAVKEKNWFIKEGTHEAIIDRAIFYNIQDMLKRDTRTSPVKKELGLFAGFLRCPDCGRAMVIKTPTKTRHYKQYTYFACTTYLNMKKGACTRHTIRSDILEQSVFAVIKKHIDMAVEMDDFIAQINKLPIKNAATLSIKNAMETKEKEKSKKEHLLLDLYPDWKSDLISKEQYIALKAKHEAELERINGALIELKKTYEREKEGVDGTNGFLRNFIKFRNFEGLSREILISLVDCIFIHEGADAEIKFKFQDAYQRAADYIEANENLLINAACLVEQMKNLYKYKVMGGV